MSARKPKRPAAKAAQSTDTSANAIANAQSTGYSIVECAMHSLESQEIGHPEQEALKAALCHLWAVSEWLSDHISETSLDDADEEDES